MNLPSPVGIVGLGLLGGSLARSLRASDPDLRILASSREPEELQAALGEGVIHEALEDPAEVAARAALLVYAVPLGVLLDLLGTHVPLWGPGTVVTDVASLKGPVLRRVRELGGGARFVGSHPMAGAEESGFPASRPGLFDDAPVWLVAGEARPGTRRTVELLWRSVGGCPRWGEAEAHDRTMVLASHLPQLTATALARTLAEAGIARAELGPGGRDMTRLAGSSSRMWADLLRVEASRAAHALRDLAWHLDALAGLLEEEDLDGVVAWMERTRRWKEGEGGV